MYSSSESVVYCIIENLVTLVHTLQEEPSEVHPQIGAGGVAPLVVGKATSILANGVTGVNGNTGRMGRTTIVDYIDWYGWSEH